MEELSDDIHKTQIYEAQIKNHETLNPIIDNYVSNDELNLASVVVCDNEGNNPNKPWREIIRRQVIDGGSHNNDPL